jgi:WS/DGAT/MGAT family acyltransferase
VTERELRFQQKMTDAEAMMWTIEKDPYLSSNIGTITILDRPPDFDAFRMRIAAAVADIPRMRERVAPVLGRLSPPDWQPDLEFDLDFHVRRVALAAPGSDRQLFDLATTLMQEPFDRTRSLWLFVVIEGLSDGRAALLSKLHHTITDGEGGVRLAERYMEIERDALPPSKIDLADAIEPSGRATARRGGGLLPSLARTAGHGWRRVLGVARRTAGEAALAVVDPPRIVEGARNTRNAVRSALDQLQPDEPGSPVWTKRSRNRRYDVLDVPFAPAKDAAKRLGGTLNDLFVTGATIGAVKYHDVVGAEATAFNVTFIRSTREDRSAGGNAFTPSKVRVPGGPMDLRERFARVRDAMAARNREAAGADLMGAVAGFANLLPTSVVTGVARGQAAAIDFATSNVRAAPFELFVSGAKVLAPYPIGPVAGTAWNITMLSYAGRLCMGVHIDPVAVEQPELLVHCIDDAFRELLQVP